MSLAASNPFDAPQVWDVLVIAGKLTPGLAKLQEVVRKHEWDVKKGKGAKGATETLTQLPPAEITFEFFVWSKDQCGLWDAILPLFKYDPTRKTVSAVDVYHPSLADVDVTSVVTVDIGGWTHEGGGLYRRLVKLLEYYPAANADATGTANGSTGTDPNDPNNANNNPDTTPDAADAQEKAIDDLWKKYQAA